MKNTFFGLILLLSLSFSAHAKKMTVHISGMTCPSCADSIGKQLEEIEAVSNVEVQLKKGLATVTLKEGQKVKNQSIHDAVQNAGFKVKSIQIKN